MNNKHNRAHVDRLYRAMLTLESADECAALFDDLCTISEINAMAQRLEVAALLRENMVYHEIVARTGASSATISRVARCLNHGTGGYMTALARLDQLEKEEC